MQTMTDFQTLIVSLGGLFGPLFTIEDIGGIFLNWSAEDIAVLTWDSAGEQTYSAWEEVVSENLEEINAVWIQAVCSAVNAATGGLS